MYQKEPISHFSDEEIASLPDVFLCMTRYPGSSVSHYIFGTVLKSDFIKNPNKCFLIDSYWGYASGRDIYIATYKDIEEWRKKKIDDIEKEFSKLSKYIVKS